MDKKKSNEEQMLELLAQLVRDSYRASFQRTVIQSALVIIIFQLAAIMWTLR